MEPRKRKLRGERQSFLRNHQNRQTYETTDLVLEKTGFRSLRQKLWYFVGMLILIIILFLIAGETRWVNLSGYWKSKQERIFFLERRITILSHLYTVYDDRDEVYAELQYFLGGKVRLKYLQDDHAFNRKGRGKYRNPNIKWKWDEWEPIKNPENEGITQPSSGEDLVEGNVPIGAPSENENTEITNSLVECLGLDTLYPLCILHNVCQDGYGYNRWNLYGVDEFSFDLYSDEFCTSKQHFNFKTALLSSDHEVKFEPGLHILHKPFYPFNFGHVLGDDIFSLYQALFLFNHSDHAVLLHEGDLREPSMKLYELLPQLSLKQWKGTLFQKPTCYEKLMLGFTKLGYAVARYDDFCNADTRMTHGRPEYQGDFLEMMRRFREYSFSVMNINRQRPKSQITFIRKSLHAADNKLAWKNIEECVSFMEHSFPEESVQLVTWVGMSVKEQVQVMHDTKIFIGLPGSNLMNAVWLNDDTVIIYVCRTTDCSRGNEWGIWFSNFHWIRHESLDLADIRNVATANEIVNPIKLVEIVRKHLAMPDSDKLRMRTI